MIGLLSLEVPHRTKSRFKSRKYDYNFKQKHNLFNIDSLCRKLPKKPFIKGYKQEIEALIIHYWLHEMVVDEERFWDEYLLSIIPVLKANNTLNNL